MSAQEELDARAQALRAQGFVYREIGEQMGETTGKAWDRCNRERENAATRRYKDRHREAVRSYWREYEEAHRHPCSSCGKPIRRESQTCADCVHAAYLRKARQVERLWNEGKTMRDIQAAMGWSKSMVSVMMTRYRADGFDLPHRRPRNRERG